jgi:hypothetical protein
MLPRILRYILVRINPDIPMAHHAEPAMLYLPYIALSTLLVLASLCLYQ